MADQPSKYQQAIYDVVESGSGDLIVQAVAGAGKTSTLVGIANRLPQEVNSIFLAFNKSIQLELAERLPKHVVAKTFNAFGFSILKENKIFTKVEVWKYSDIIKDLSKRIFPNITDEEREELESATKDHANMARLNLTGCSTLVELEIITKSANQWSGYPVKSHGAGATKYAEYSEALVQQANDYDLPVLGGEQHDRMCRLVVNVLLTGVKVATGKSGPKVIDLTDQVWLPVILKLPTAPFDFVMVDEAQDLKRCELNLIHKARKPQGGRFVFVGDRNQALYRFAGADSSSMDRIKQVTGAQELPLSICYRCPQSHIDLAASIYQGIEGKPNNAHGKLQYGLDVDKAVEMALPTVGTKCYQDLFICRNNAPLLKVAYRLIRAGKPAKVRGKKIGEGLVVFAKRIKTWGNKNGYRSFDDFAQCLDSYYTDKCKEAKDTLKAEKVDAACEALNDKVETVRVIFNAKRSASLADLERDILSIFDDTGSTIWLSTVHKAKGLEAKRVFIIEPQLMPSRYAKSPEAIVQEHNILYVAVTRAKEALFFLKPIEESADEDIN